jgi:uncharacterized protein with PhoU and TrkA domain
MHAVIHECQCAACLQSKDHPDWQLHHKINALVSRLDEQQRRWYVAIESERIGHGGDTLLSQITGMDIETIRRGRRELDEDMASRPTERVREVGGGQPAVEKKTRRSRRL